MHGIILTGFNTVIKQAHYKRTGGAHRIATYLRERDWDIEVLDFLMGWKLDQLKEFTRSRVTNKTVFLGFGGTFPIWSETLEQYFQWVKEKYPNLKIIAGGQISNVYKIDADWYVDGFGERALEALLKHITGTSSEPLKYQLGINGRKVIKGNMDYPSFPMKSLKIKYEDRDFILADETLVTELGRGCIFNCAFCNFPILGVKEDHSRDAEDLYEELKDNYDRFGVTKYTIADETVNDYSEKLEKFAKVIKRLDFKPRMFGFARADLLVSRKKDWDTCIEMGFVGHHYGIESTNPKSLKVIGKGMHPDKLLPGLLEVKDYFRKNSTYKGQVSLIAGLPYETKDSLHKTLKWFRENWKTENVMLFPLYIPKNDGRDSASKLSGDWGKYNYRETKLDLYPRIRELFKELPTQYGVGEALLEHTGMSWENDEWNIFDAMMEVGNFYANGYADTYGPVMWSLGEYETALEKPFEYFYNKTMKDIIGSGEFGDFKKFLLVSNRLIDGYIEKKLNWKAS
jgi:radical SAM superfamily enzyme YgiQ (UPF0313 family)